MKRNRQVCESHIQSRGVWTIQPHHSHAHLHTVPGSQHYTGRHSYRPQVFPRYTLTPVFGISPGCHLAAMFLSSSFPIHPLLSLLPPLQSLSPLHRLPFHLPFHPFLITLLTPFSSSSLPPFSHFLTFIYLSFILHYSFSSSLRSPFLRPFLFNLFLSFPLFSSSFFLLYLSSPSFFLTLSFHSFHHFSFTSLSLLFPFLFAILSPLHFSSSLF